MAKYTEDQLTSWTKPPSDSEQTKLENSERMVREAISSDEKLKTKTLQITVEGPWSIFNASRRARKYFHDVEMNYKDEISTKKLEFGSTKVQFLEPRNRAAIAKLMAMRSILCP